MACLNSVGKQPVTSDRLISRAMKGARCDSSDDASALLRTLRSVNDEVRNRETTNNVLRIILQLIRVCLCLDLLP